MSVIIASTLIASAILFAVSARQAIQAIQHQTPPPALAWPTLIGYVSIALVCVGEAVWLLVGQGPL